ncbi:hypothetical protein FQR65_LT02436 [Abscondita terminalis]|nr:hypothetical protein FQR65_LT02436 [Abscondita terminalis]
METGYVKRKSSIETTTKHSIGEGCVHCNTTKSQALLDDFDAFNINYQDEMVLVLFNSMLEVIVKEWKPLSTDALSICVCQPPPRSQVIEGSIGSANPTENLSQSSKLRIGDSASSIRSLKSGRRDSLKMKLSKTSERSKSSIHLNSEIIKTNENITLKTSEEASESLTSLYIPEWIVFPRNENVKITFKNGNEYEGPTFKKLMHGYGKFKWADGTIYEGDFVNGYATGHGVLRYPDLTIYKGEFCNSVLQGYGELNISLTAMTYNGFWKDGKKHGNGWMLYESDDWYNGEWFEGKRHGKGVRNYKTGEKYQGNWSNNLYHGKGTFVWTNNDVYTGDWENGKMHGYGEYTWNSFLNEKFIYPVQNTYKGLWKEGVREGAGVLDFGFDSGARLAAVFCNNRKHGAGILVCGNGTMIQHPTLFWEDKPAKVEELPVVDNTNCPVNISYCNEIRTPLHAPPEDADFSYLIDLAVKEYTPILFKEHLNAPDLDIKATTEPVQFSPSTASKQIKHHPSMICQASIASTDYHTLLAIQQLQHQEIEKVNLRDTITSHLPKLYKLYEKYATITTRKKVEFKPILIRYFFWQFIRDVNFFGSKCSLIDIDLIINENPSTGLEFIHFPFEKIYFWQFLQVLLSIAWKFHSPTCVTDECKTYGVLSTIFSHFLNEIIFFDPKITESYSIFEYRDLLPIDSVYKFYKTFGEPHTAKTLFKNVCVKKHENPACYLRSWDVDVIPMRRKGKNIVSIGGNVIYMENYPSKIGEPSLPDERADSTDPFRNHLFCLRDLGPKRIMKCLIRACPLIADGNTILNIDYPLAFIEFYDTILLCTYTLVRIRRLRLERIRQLEEAKLQKFDEEETIVNSNSNLRKPSGSSADKDRSATGKKGAPGQSTARDRLIINLGRTKHSSPTTSGPHSPCHATNARLKPLTKKNNI